MQVWWQCTFWVVSVLPLRGGLQVQGKSIPPPWAFKKAVWKKGRANLQGMQCEHEGDARH